jgi:transcriptional regulator with XRE-family HTH domain
MGDTTRIILALKRALRSRGITYAMLAKRISLSEPSVKRILSRGSLSLPRLERICEAAGLSMEELVRPVAASPAETSSTLSATQESALAADPQLLACFYLLTNGHTPRDVAAELNADEKLLRRWLVKLDNLHLVELRARLGARLRVAPIRAKTDRSAVPTKTRCARSSCAHFSGAGRDRFRSAGLVGCRIVLQRKLARLSSDFKLPRARPAPPRRERAASA